MQMFYTTIQGDSKQEWLGSVSLCPCCNSQQPKDGFKMINGEEICARCQKEALADEINSPKEIALEAKVYDGLLAVSQWYDAMPTDVQKFNTGDRFHENVFDYRASCIPDDALPEETYLDYFELSDDGLYLVCGDEETGMEGPKYKIVRKS